MIVGGRWGWVVMVGASLGVRAYIACHRAQTTRASSDASADYFQVGRARHISVGRLVARMLMPLSETKLVVCPPLVASVMVEGSWVS